MSSGSNFRQRDLVSRIQRARETVARAMVKHDMPHLIVTIRFLEAEQDKLRQQTAAMDYAKEILAKRAQHRKQHQPRSCRLSF